jgi:hypothetical protein
MNPHRKGNAFPTQGVPGDPRLLDQLHRQQIRGPNMAIQHTHSGTLIIPAGKSRPAPPTVSGPFCKKYTSEGEILLLGGTVTGGSGNITVPDLSLATVGEEPVDGTHHWLEVSITAIVEDDVLLPGGDVTAATDGSGTTLPDNTIPTYSSAAGTLYISLGSWALGKFTPAGCGNIQVSHCPGSLTYSRAGEIF